MGSTGQFVTLSGANGVHVQIATGLFINNQFITSRTGRVLDTFNPATGDRLATVASADSSDIDAAVESAEAALNGAWKSTSPAARGRLLYRLADLVERDTEKLAFLEAIDAGVLFNDSKNMNVPQAVETLRYFAGWSDKISGKLLQIPVGMAYTTRDPIGVCAAIIPWNAPLMITIWKLAPAIAAGNVITIKTPELAPLYGQLLGELIVEAGFPPGVINIVTGDGPVAGQAISEHPRIRKVAFTGSAIAGRKVMKAAAETNLKKVTLELGGKGPSIVFNDADFDNALFWTSVGITAHNGQICAAGSRIYVQEGIYDKFVQAFHERTAQAVHGDPLLSSTTKGPIISKTQLSKILEYVDAGKNSGARLLHGGDALGSQGNFIANTAFADVSDDSKIMREEIFGPVASIARFSSVAEAVRKANDTEYGLAAAIFTTNIDTAHTVATAIEAGMVTVNTWAMLNANTPFGGVKQSGFGRDMGEEALEGWTVTKTVKYNILKREV